MSLGLSGLARNGDFETTLVADVSPTPRSNLRASRIDRAGWLGVVALW